MQNPRFKWARSKRRSQTAAKTSNPNAVKVVTDSKQRALYFSRATIPFDRDKTGAVHYFKHLGFLCISKAGAGSICEVAGVVAGAQRAPGAITLPGKWDRDLGCRDAIRYGRRGHRRRSAARGNDFEDISINQRSSATEFFATLPPQQFVSKLPDASGRTIPPTARVAFGHVLIGQLVHGRNKRSDVGYGLERITISLTFFLREYAFISGISKNDITVEASTSSGKLAKS